MDTPLRKLVEVWFGAQVELHGQYSLERLDNLQEYTKRTPVWRVVLVSILMPSLAVVLITLSDAIPLKNPALGLSESYTFWVRSYITVCAVSGGAVFQLRIIVPKLGMSYGEVIVLTLASTAAAVATQFGFAAAIGYPVPFGLVMGTPSCFVVIVAGVMLPRRELLRTKPQLRKQLNNYVNVLVCQVSMTVVYPVYNYVFGMLSSSAQTAFVMLLPLIKLINKNWLSYSLRDTDDLRPELVVFNVEIFHALYVSICMQSSTSIYTTIAIMAVDLLQAWLSLRDVDEVLREMQPLLAKIPPTGHRVNSDAASPNPHDSTRPSTPESSKKHRRQTIMETVGAILEADPNVRKHASLRQTCFVASSQSRRVSSIFEAISSRLGSGHRPKSSVTGSKNLDPTSRTAMKFVVSSAIHPSCTDDDDMQQTLNGQVTVASATGLNAQERVELVQKALRMLFLTEFVVLVEYAEVMIPVIYCACTIGMIRLPNREFYHSLASKTDDELKHTFGNVALYGSLEFLSFVLFSLLLRYKLRYSVLTQVAFVLERQFVMVQAKLMMWVFYVIETSLYHFGADFGFSFSWLRAAP